VRRDVVPKLAEPIRQGQRVFTCGHSFHVWVPDIVADLCKKAEIPHHVQVGLSSIGGSKVIQHWNIADEKNKAKEALKTGKVDVLTLSPIFFPDEGIATVYIHCASGTYVRSIAHDLGTKLKCGAHVHELTRTKFSEFSLQETCAPEGPLDALKASYIPMERMLAHLPEVILDSSQGAKILNGSSIEIKQDFQDSWVRVFSKDRHLLALAQVQPNHQIQPKIVFN
jgi:tRNA U55 pseudouridine synthase TruB